MAFINEVWTPLFWILTCQLLANQTLISQQLTPLLSFQSCFGAEAQTVLTIRHPGPCLHILLAEQHIISLKFDADNQAPHRLNPDHSDDLLTFPLAPALG